MNTICCHRTHSWSLTQNRRRRGFVSEKISHVTNRRHSFARFFLSFRCVSRLGKTKFLLFTSLSVCSQTTWAWSRRGDGERERTREGQREGQRGCEGGEKVSASGGLPAGRCTQSVRDGVVVHLHRQDIPGRGQWCVLSCCGNSHLHPLYLSGFSRSPFIMQKTWFVRARLQFGRHCFHLIIPDQTNFVPWENLLFLKKKVLVYISPFCGGTDTPVFDFRWCLPWVLNPPLTCMLCHLHTMYSSGATPSDLLTASMAAEPFDPHTCTCIQGYSSEPWISCAARCTTLTVPEQTWCLGFFACSNYHLFKT